jgi:hypothetical protein
MLAIPEMLHHEASLLNDISTRHVPRSEVGIRITGQALNVEAAGRR